ncbi:hypothetical protein [Rhodospirillum rubrum]|uniref:Uncharacterized protein n=1 Tax=Rhodospirillum rubrum (strain ATCC 11170 / ATH 1.1.1 / DSM 467 / LMG 4362 / NCIMB 8255 / S1) TaxID=269796 RepID=Q2RTL4_RHORT|nr:hypothetical protein [Rhodospirillum rubrum]ABC22531.1 conserved hypothetical protein [Rhodospirillum rubrum ATCC 11170]AEO48249.1 hypothetical protein F11_08915 [Rhodospirillum rubrum F11]MBK1663536.1 hypothetical protein [Rhodospirillum rubrum]MBK1675663.1 hypothetical protein [Rhodospirillum rubrum]MBK5954119.1 hypothetical protein [Rhodospirillum rubrum]
MADSTDREHLLNYRHFIEDVEQAIRASNREIIGAKIPGLDRKSFYRMAITVAKLRAAYLDAVLHVDWDGCSEGLAKVKARRALYEEAKAGFEALQHAIERGYINVVEAQP